MKFFVKTKLSENISETPEGFLLCRNVPLTHTGSLRYAFGEHPFEEHDGDVIMKREPSELFSPATMASFEGKDLTIQHPDDFVDPDNYQELTNGVLVNIRKGSEQIEVEGEMVEPLLGDILVKSKEAINLVRAGVREVSLGYDAFWELIKDGEGRHSKIIGNHIALVSSGRAGKQCAINDHKKEKEIMGKELADKFKKLFGKTVDEAVKEKEDKETKDAEEAKAAKDAEEAEAAKKAKDEEEKKKKEEESKDEEGSDVEKRLSNLEVMVEKILSKLEGSSEDEESEEDEDEVIVEDEEESEDEEASDEGYEGDSEDEEAEEDKKEKKAGDTLSRAEILAPGIKKTKTIVVDALKKAYKTADGKKVIDSLTGGKCPSTLSKETAKTVFVAASEMMKAKRTKDFASQRITTIDSFPALKGTGTKTADDINKMNAAHYSNKK